VQSPPELMEQKLETAGHIKKDALVPAVAEAFGVSESTVWNAIKSPVAPEWTLERFIAIATENLAIAERSGNRPAVRFLLRVLRDPLPFFEHSSLQSK
jgi:hypothetical protein